MNTHKGQGLSSERERNGDVYPFNRLRAIYRWLARPPSAATRETESHACSAAEPQLRRPNLAFLPWFISLKNSFPYAWQL